MSFPVLISLIISLILTNFGVNDLESVNLSYIKEKGRVLGVAESSQNIFAEASSGMKSFNDYLPSNDSPTIPKRKKNSESLILPIESGIVIEAKSGMPLWDKTAQEVRSIASISKLMTALVFLDNNPGWETIYEIKENDRREGGRIYLWTGEKVRVKDLFYLSLVGSANTATIALANSTGMNVREFVAEMNKKARDLGFIKTAFSDPAGLSKFNVSTAFEVAKLAKISFSELEIKDATLERKYFFKTMAGRDVHVESTDKLLETFPINDISIIGGKTGYTEPAGFCFAGQFEDSEDREIILVVLGSESIDDRFKCAKDLAEWTFASYNW